MEEFLLRLSQYAHLPATYRDRLAQQIRSLEKNFAETDESNSFLELYQEIFSRLFVFFDFALEHTRQDTQKVLEEMLSLLNPLLVLEGDFRRQSLRAQEVFQMMDQKSDEFFSVVPKRYRIDLEKLEKKLTQGKGLPPPIAAVYRSFSRSKVIESFDQQIKTYGDFLEEAKSFFENDFRGSFVDRWEAFRKAGRAYELAKYFGLPIRNGKNNFHALDQKYQSVLKKNHGIERLNHAFLSIQSLEPIADEILSRGDGQWFYEDIQRQLQNGVSLPKTLNIVECGIGDGSFAADFLDRLAELDLEHIEKHASAGHLVYPRVCYYLCDASEEVLEKAQNNLKLKKHAKVTRYQKLQGNHPPIISGGIYYGRFHEFFDQFSKSPVIYIDQKGKFHELRVALKIPKDAVIRSADYGQGDEKEFKKRLLKSNQDFSDFHIESLQEIEVDCELHSIDKIPHKNEIQEIVGNLREVIFPMSIGACDYLEKIYQQLIPNCGFLQIFDFGFKEVNLLQHQSYHYTSQLNRNFGNTITNDLSFPLLGLWARKKGLKSSIFLQEDLSEKITGEKMLDTTPFVPTYSGRALIRHVSVNGGIFSWRFLKHADEIERRSKERAQPQRNEEQFLAFVRDLQKKKYLGYAPFQYHEAAKSDLENLAMELDFWVNGIFRSLVGGEYFRWIPLENNFIQKALEMMGFEAEKVIQNIHKNPYYGAFWVLRMESIQN